MKRVSILILVVLAAFAFRSEGQVAIGNTNVAGKTTTRSKMKVEIWSDMVCPFCYLGKRRIEAAMKQFADAGDVEVVWHSFQLYPGLPKHTKIKENSYQYIANAKGVSYEQSVRMHEGVVAMAKADGLQYNFDKAIVANSYNAHRLLQMAKARKLGNVAEERIFKAYFNEGKDIGDNATLTQLGKEIGLNEKEVAQMLTGNDYSDKVDADLKEAAQLGINGVPFFIFNRKYAISGAQPVDTFLNTLQRSHAEWRVANPR